MLSAGFLMAVKLKPINPFYGTGPGWAAYICSGFADAEQAAGIFFAFD